MEEARIREIFREELNRYFSSPFCVAPERHWKHHDTFQRCVDNIEEREEDHKFVQDLRKGVGTAKEWTIKTIIGALITAILAGMVLALRGQVRP